MSNNDDPKQNPQADPMENRLFREAFFREAYREATARDRDFDSTGMIIARTIDAVEHRFRRYALLQAATLILYSPEFRSPAAQTPYLAAIDYAEQMLAEIERREK